MPISGRARSGWSGRPARKEPPDDESRRLAGVLPRRPIAQPPVAAVQVSQIECQRQLGTWFNSTEIQVEYLAAVIADRQIAIDDPRRPDVLALLERHLQFARAQTPPEHSFALDVEGLVDPAITLFSVRADGSLLGIGAIKRLGPDHAEIKSMHTAETARGRGIGRDLLA